MRPTQKTANHQILKTAYLFNRKEFSNEKISKQMNRKAQVDFPETKLLEQTLTRTTLIKLRKARIPQGLDMS